MCGKRFFLAWLSLGLVTLAATHAKADKRNILLVLSDDHSVPHVGCYGNPNIKTPISPTPRNTFVAHR